MYILSNIGVARYYLTEARSRFNPILHLVIPIVATIAVGVVGYESAVPLPPPPEQYAPIFLAIWLAIGAAILIYLRVRGNEDWLKRAQMAFTESE